MNTDITPIKLDGSGYSITVTPEAEKAKKLVLGAAAQIKTVEDRDTALVAQNCMRDLNELLKSLEKCRKEVKDPILQAGARVDAAAKTFAKELDEEKGRLNKLVADHAAEQHRLQQAALEKQRKADEEARLAAELEEKKRLDAELAAQRAAEADEKAKKLSDFKKVHALEEKARLEREVAEAAARDFAQAEEERALANLAVASSAPLKGIKPTLDFEVTDIHALYRSYPGLCDVTVKRRDVLSHLKACQESEEDPSLPGIKVIEKFTVSTR